MAIAAHLQELRDDSGNRRAARRTLLLTARGTTSDGDTAAVLVHNISTTGLLFETQSSLAAGESMDIELPEAGMIRANVVWKSGKLFGCQFDMPISAAVLSAAQLRGATGGQVVLNVPASSPGESFGSRLQRLRKDGGLTLADLADALGVSKPTVWAWEQGRARPVASRIGALAKALGVAEAELLRGEDSATVRELVARSREQIAEAIGTNPDKVRIMIDL